MTSEEKRLKMEQRNLDLCIYYKQGHKLSECASKFGLGRQRVQQILQAANVWTPYQKSCRTQFLGVSVSEDTKTKLEALAEQKGVSVSKLTSDELDRLVTQAAE